MKAISEVTTEDIELHFKISIDNGATTAQAVAITAYNAFEISIHEWNSKRHDTKKLQALQHTAYTLLMSGYLVAKPTMARTYGKPLTDWLT